MNYKPEGMSVDELEVRLRWLFAQMYIEEQFNNRNYMEIVKERL